MRRPRLFGLRLRFLSAGVLMTLTTVAAAAWTLIVLSRLAAIAASTVRDTDELTATTAAVSSALEREDDALLVILGGASSGSAALVGSRAITDRVLMRLTQDANSYSQRRIALRVQSLSQAYRRAVDSVVALPGEHPLERYHHDANPLLRDAVAEVAKYRDQRFEDARAATAKARDEVARTRNVVVLIAALAVVIGAVVALRLARHVILPMHELARAAAAIRDGNFETRVKAGPADEIGDVSEAFNEMTRRLAEFHRSNLGEVLSAKRVLEATMRALPDAVLLIDDRGYIAASNPEAERLLEAAGLAQPATAADIALAWGAESRAFRDALLHQQAFDRAALDSALNIELRGDSRRFLPRIVPLAPGGEQSGAVLVLSDVTQFARLDEMRSEVVALASHELRTPVTTLRMSLLMLREMSEHLDRRVRDLLDNALSGVDLLSETVSELLDMTRIEAGALKLDAEPINLVALGREVVQRHHLRAEELGLQLETRCLSETATVIGDPARLRIVVDNLVNNAIKYTPRGGLIVVAVAVRTLETPARVEVSVTDSGTGIPHEFATRVFEKFFRVEHYRSTREEAPRGAGIGLYLCKEIVELHGGHIRSEPTAAGSGAKIAFDLPAARALD